MTNKEPSPKYKVGDRIKERRTSKLTIDSVRYKGVNRYGKPRKGVIQNYEIKRNSKGARHFYYEILWDEINSTCIRPQHRIIPENENEL